MTTGEYEFKMAWDSGLGAGEEWNVQRVCEAVLTIGATEGDRDDARQCALVCRGEDCWSADLQCPTGPILIECRKHCPLQVPNREDLVLKFEGMKVLAE